MATINLGATYDMALVDPWFCNDGASGHHVIIPFYDPLLWNANGQLAHFNVDTGAAYSKDLAHPGDFKSECSQFYNGEIYFTIAGTNGVGQPRPQLYTYNVRTQTLTNRGEVYHFNSNNPYSSGMATDSSLYAVGFEIAGNLWWIDTATKIIVDYGIPDDPGTSVGHDIYSVVSDGSYIYCAIKGTANYLVVVKVSDQTETTFWKTTGLSNIYVSRREGTPDTCLVWVNPAQGGHSYFNLNGFTDPTTMPNDSPTSERTPWYYQANLTDLGYTFDLSHMYPALTATPAEGSVRLVWEDPSNNPFDESTTITTTPLSADILVPGKDKLIGRSGTYSSLFTIDSSGQKTTIGVCEGNANYNTYDLAYDSVNDLTYLTGYTREFLKYDQDAAWTLFWGLNTTNPAYNPHQLAQTYANDRYYRRVFAQGGIAYFVGDYSGGDAPYNVGSTIHWCDATNGNNDTLTTGLTNYNPRSAVKMASGLYLALSTEHITPGQEGKLFLYRFSDNSLYKTFAPITSSASQGSIVEIGSTGKIMGLITGSPNTYYVYDTVAESLVWSNTFSGTCFNGASNWWDKNLTYGPDGNVWLFYGSQIYKIAPANGDMSVGIASPPSTGSLVWWGNDLYIFKTADYNIYKITELVSFGETIRIHIGGPDTISVR